MATHALPARVVCSFLGRLRGLMFTLRPRCIALSFRHERRIALHMWFVFYPIDVAFLDKDARVVDTKSHFDPFTFYTSRKPAMHAVEMPHGWLRTRGIRIGDTVRFA